MAVNTKKITSGPYLGNDLADTFSYGFRVENKDQLIVYETDDEDVVTELSVDYDYTVDSVGNDAGGTIKRIAGALPEGYEWYIRSNYEETQLTTFESQGPFFPDLHENAMDKMTFLIQQLIDSINRVISLPPSYPGDLPLTLEPPDAGKVLRWNEEETGIENFDVFYEFVRKDGDTMRQPLAGPYSQTSSDYMPQAQIVSVIEDKISSAPEFDPERFIDYGLVTSIVGDYFDYGSI